MFALLVYLILDCGHVICGWFAVVEYDLLLCLVVNSLICVVLVVLC